MNETERAICSRVREFRKFIKWPQPAFASDIGITRNQLSGIEYGWTPLHFGVGLQMCRRLLVDGEWLATGIGEMFGNSLPLRSTRYDSDVFAHRLFSEVYRESPVSFRSYGSQYPLIVSAPTPGFDPKDFLLKKIKEWFQESKFATPLLAEQFARAISDHAESVLLVHRRAGAAKRVRVNRAKLDLTDSETSEKLMDVKLHLPSLLGRLNRATGETGKMSALAKYLGVPLASVSRWLSGKREPGGEITLKMLRWVEQQEHQLKRP
ncbi:MAG TPA: helix-turn-helix transcriptional regulator [Candidatus Limnocylindrales bacterium]|nr:helix-turn-helix transcriptional regulator [Candidatus Limnocylindrales bacterium]